MQYDGMDWRMAQTKSGFFHSPVYMSEVHFNCNGMLKTRGEEVTISPKQTRLLVVLAIA